MKTAAPTSSPLTGGFTLIEILIATAIMAIVLAAMHAAFFAALRLREKSVDSLEAGLPVEEALQTIQHDLENVQISTNGVLIGPLQTVNQTNMVPGQIGPDFYTSDGELDGLTPWGNIQKIDYLLTAQTNGVPGPGQALVRAITHNLLPVNQQPMPDEEQTILTGVQSLTFQYYDGAQWDNAWDTTQQTNLPLAIKVQIFMAQGNASAIAANEPLELVVPLDVMLSTNPITPIQ